MTDEHTETLKKQKYEIMERIMAGIEIPERMKAIGLFSDYVFLRDYEDQVAYFYENGGQILSHEVALSIIQRLMEFYQRVTPEEIEILNTPIPRPQPQVTKPTPPKTYPGYVYLIRAENGIYKIGRTAVPEDRAKTFSVKLPFEIEYAALIKTGDMHGLERQLHRRFAAKRGNGEWFALDADDVAYIKSLAVDDE